MKYRSLRYKFFPLVLLKSSCFERANKSAKVERAFFHARPSCNKGMAGQNLNMIRFLWYPQGGPKCWYPKFCTSMYSNVFLTWSIQLNARLNVFITLIAFTNSIFTFCLIISVYFNYCHWCFMWIIFKDGHRNIYHSFRLNPSAMEVLKYNRFVMRLVNLSNKSGFHLSNYRIPNVCINLLLMCPMSVCSMQMMLFCCQSETELKSVFSAIYLCLGILSILAMHICLAINNDLIIDTVDHLQQIVARSKYRTYL